MALVDAILRFASAKLRFCFVRRCPAGLGSRGPCDLQPGQLMLNWNPQKLSRTWFQLSFMFLFGLLLFRAPLFGFLGLMFRGQLMLNLGWLSVAAFLGAPQAAMAACLSMPLSLLLDATMLHSSATTALAGGAGRAARCWVVGRGCSFHGVCVPFLRGGGRGLKGHQQDAFVVCVFCEAPFRDGLQGSQKGVAISRDDFFPNCFTICFLSLFEGSLGGFLGFWGDWVLVGRM